MEVYGFIARLSFCSRNLGEAKAKYKCMDRSEFSCSLKRALPLI